MALLGLLLMAGTGAYLFYFFALKTRVTDTPVMREFYGYTEDETLAKMWPNGTLWMREVGDREKSLVKAGEVADWIIGVRVISMYDTFALSLTTDGVFILQDNKKDDNVGTLRFRREDIQSVSRLNPQNNAAASGLGRTESAFDVELTLKNGGVHWIQIPGSAYEAMTGISPDGPI